ncbi:MAG TPA: serine/threonine-protein kinase [Gallionellaceae bacterium]|nr:serine/threonine-protein kinase [Gallionellaceae bacterium]
MVSLKFWKKNDDANKHKPGGPHKMLGTFEVTRELGRGSMGVVYQGKDPASGRDVAIKTITLANEFNANVLEDAKSQFMREAKILTWLDHPDIVTIYDVGEEHGLAYIAMEFLKGMELAQHTKPDNLLPLPKTLEIMARAADALGYAHEQNIVHRDVKPGNIMYDASSNMVKVTDFGISRLATLSATRGGVVLGSPLYMSPEQVMGKQINGLSDLFSLGITFYQLASGRLPFEGDSEFDVMYRVAKEPHTDILSFKPELPACVCAIINRALEKAPEDRFHSGSDMAEAIRQCATKL